MSMLKSINKKDVVNWPLLHTTAEAQCTVTPKPNMCQPDIIGGWNNYADSCFEFFYFFQEKVPHRP